MFRVVVVPALLQVQVQQPRRNPSNTMKTHIKLAVTFASLSMVAFALTACDDKGQDDGPSPQPTEAELKAKNNMTNAFPGMKPGETPPGPGDSKKGRPPGGYPGGPGGPGGPSGPPRP